MLVSRRCDYSVPVSVTSSLKALKAPLSSEHPCTLSEGAQQRRVDLFLVNVGTHQPACSRHVGLAWS